MNGAVPQAIPETFTTSRLRMRRPREGDSASAFTNWTSDPDVVRYLPWRRHETVADTAAYLDSLVQRWIEGTAFTWMITVPPADDCVGLAMIKYREPDAEIGYSIARALWGQGLVSEVAGELLRLAFEFPRVERALAVVDTENTASIRVLEKLRMTWAETFTDGITHPNISDVPRPCHRFAITRQQWQG
jgi:ribosomal-protein-alanine N-acetyltransferase